MSWEHDPVRAALVREINDAFDGVPIRGGVTLHQARELDNYGGPDDVRRARDMDPEERWQDVPDQTIVDLDDALWFLDPVGFCFYAPAFMTRLVKYHESSGGSVIHRITRALVPDRDAGGTRLERYAAFTPEQARAVCRFLRYIGPADHDENAEAALEVYWGRFCAADPVPPDSEPHGFRSSRRSTTP